MSAGLLFDTNVLIDVASHDPVWFAWSDDQLARASGRSLVIVNPIIVAELTHAFASKQDQTS